MAALLYRLLNCRERRPFSLRGRALTLALLPAQELLAARLAGETAEDPLEGALHGSGSAAASGPGAADASFPAPVRCSKPCRRRRSTR